MSFVKTLVENEPLLVRLAAAAVAVAAGYGLPLPEGAGQLLAELIASVLSLWLLWDARSKVTPMAKITQQPGDDS